MSKGFALIFAVERQHDIEFVGVAEIAKDLGRRELIAVFETHGHPAERGFERAAGFIPTQGAFARVNGFTLQQRLEVLTRHIEAMPDDE